MSQQTISGIIASSLSRAMCYAEYLALGSELHAQNKTTGPNQSETLLAYSKLNEQRSNRLAKTLVVNEDLIAATGQINQPTTWLAITEWWCGDSAQNLPLFAKLAALNENIDLRLVLRDEHPELMNCFLTNGSRSIPKVIGLDSENEVLWIWGPRPAPAQQMMTDWKAAAEPKIPYAEATESLHRWYAADKCQTLQKEILALLSAG